MEPLRVAALSDRATGASSVNEIQVKDKTIFSSLLSKPWLLWFGERSCFIHYIGRARAHKAAGVTPTDPLTALVIASVVSQEGAERRGSR